VPTNHPRNGSTGPDTALPRKFKLDNGVEVTVRAIRPEDAEIEQAFVRSLSLKSRHLRFFNAVRELSPQMLETFTHPNYPDSWALIATVRNGASEKEIGVARYAPSKSASGAEFAVAVADDWQKRGIGTQLMKDLLAVAERAGVPRIEGVVLRQNKGMLALAEDLGFVARQDPDDPAVLIVVKNLDN